MTPLCLTNADWILVGKQGRQEWGPRLFEEASLPRDRIEASTCDLAGVKLGETSYRMQFADVRFFDDDATVDS